jgi:multidrug efflux pump subunit AcrA (membrane-fusion protein)
MNIHRSTVLTLSVYGLLLLLICSALFGTSCAPPETDLPFIRPVKVDIIDSTNIAQVLILEGNVEAERVIAIPPYRSGIVKDIRVEVNDQVRKGEILFTIDQATITGGNFEPTAIYSPINGVISEINVKEGATVASTSSLGTVIQQDIMKILCDIPAEKVFALEERLKEARLTGHQMLCWIKVPAHEDELIGWVEQIYPVDEKLTRTAKVEIRYDNADRLLRHNMFARVELFMGEEETILIPKDAVIAEQMLRYVMVYKPVAMEQNVKEKAEAEQFGKISKQVVQVNENQSIVRVKVHTLELEGNTIAKTLELDDRVELLRGVEEGELIVVESQKWVSNKEIVVLTEPTFETLQAISEYPNPETVTLENLLE